MERRMVAQTTLRSFLVGPSVLASAIFISGCFVTDTTLDNWYDSGGRAATWDTNVETDADDTDGTGTEQYTGAMYLGVDTSNPSYPMANGSAADAFGWGCDPGTNMYWFLFYTVGWSSGAELAIYQTGATNGWREDYHDVPPSSQGFAENGRWDSLYLELPIVGSIGEVVLNNTSSGETGTTLFQCNQALLT